MVRHASILLFIILAVSLSAKIDLNTADIGRHIKNGEIMLAGSSADRSAVLNTNFYSYAEGNRQFINHHWGSGVIFYLIFYAAGFDGLSLFYILLYLIAFWFFFDVARRGGNATIALLSALLVIPMLSSRAEVRPEVFSYLFSGLYFWIGWRYIQGEIGKKWLFALAAFQIIWVNLHIGFVQKHSH